MSTTRGNGKRSMSDRGRENFMGMLTGRVTNLEDFESDLHSNVDGEREVAEEIAEEVDELEEEEEVEEEMHTQNDEHTSEQHEPVNLKTKDKIERDERGREILIIEGKSFVSVAASRCMLSDMRGWYTDVWPIFHKVPDTVKRYLFERFKEKFTWHAQWSEQQVYNIFKSYCSRSFSAEMMRLRTVKKSRSASPPDYMRQDIWDALWDIWDTDKFKKLQENNRKNRVSDRDGNGTVKSSAGTVPIPLHARRMANKNGGIPVPHEMVFNRCHRTNQGKGPFVDEKSKRTSETYTRLKENHPQSSGSAMLSQGSSTFIPEAWAEASGGPKNGRCYGFGNSYSASFTSCGTFPNNNSSPAEVQQLKEEMREIKREQQEIKTSLSEILSFIRACQANFSGQHFSPGQYSYSQHSAPSPGQYPPSALAGQYPPSAPAGQYPPSDPSGQYPPSASAPSHSQYPATGSGQYLPTAPGYYPAPHPGYFMTPATQFHVPGHYQASSQHPAVHSQLPDQVPSPSQHNSFGQRHSQE